MRRLVFRHGALWAGDEMGSVCRSELISRLVIENYSQRFMSHLVIDSIFLRWSADLKTCELKKEYYTEIWSLVVSNDKRTIYTAR